MVPLICPTCQNVFAGKASMPATPCYFAWGCFRYFSWEREPRRPCGCLSRDDRRVACRAVARVQRSPPSPDGLWRGSLRYEMACPAGQTANWRCAQSYANPSPCYLANIRVIFENNSEPAAESVKKACSTGISRISHQFDIREEQGAPNCPNTERALANWEAGK